MNLMTSASPYPNYTKVSFPLLVSLHATATIRLYPWLEQQLGQVGHTFRCSLAQLISLLEAPTDSTVDELLTYELHWARLELNQRAPFSFRATKVSETLEESVVELLIDEKPVPSTAFGYLLLARNEAHAHNIYLITTTRTQPDVYVDKLSSQKETPGHFELLSCYPVLEPAGVRKRGQALLETYNQLLNPNYYRMNLEEAEAYCRQLAGQPTLGLT